MGFGQNALTGWNSEIAALPGAHILQTWEWGQFKAIYDWRPIPKIWRDEQGEIKAAAMVLQRSIRLAGFGPEFKILYVPRGPMLDWQDVKLRQTVLTDLQALAKKTGAIFIKIDPEVALGRGTPEEGSPPLSENANEILTNLQHLGWQYSQDQIQFRNTVVIDLTGTEEDWLARMKQKARYNLRLAHKKGVTVRKGTLEDLPLVYRMYAETSVRDGFVIRPEGYYRHAWEGFIKSGLAEILLAEVEGEVVAGLIVFFFAGKAWYLYGMSRQIHRDKMPNYLLQWEAMRFASAHGCKQYDLWGAPDVFDDSDSMWGVFRFKEGLGGEVVRFIGAWDYPSRPLLYRLYTQFLPGFLNILRRRGKARVRREVSL